jgi:hypothetical protein
MADVALLIQSGFTPKKEWIERHFRVELQDKKEAPPEPAQEQTTYNPDEDEDLYGSIFGDDAESPEPASEPKPFEGEDITEDEAATISEEEG